MHFQNRQYKYYSTGLLSTFDLYDNPYSCNVKDEPEEDGKPHSAKKRKYNKTGKYKKITSDQPHDNVDSTDTNVCIIRNIIFLTFMYSTLNYGFS